MSARTPSKTLRFPRDRSALARLLLPAALLCTLVACDRAADAPATATPAGPADTPAPATPAATANAADRPAAAVQPGEANPLPITPEAIAYFGFRTAPFGSDEKMLRSAWSGPLVTQGPPQVDACYYLYPEGENAASGHRRIGFMMEGGRFRRIDVDTPTLVAPGGGRIGMSTHEIATLYTERLEVKPHKYVDGAHYLRVPDAGGSGQVLVFETDVDGRVVRWRIGQTPQVDYVEGCA